MELKVRVSEAEAVEVRAWAQDSGMSVNECVRRAISFKMKADIDGVRLIEGVWVRQLLIPFLLEEAPAEVANVVRE